VGVKRPRVRAADGSGELPVAAYELFSQTEVLGRLALERMLGGLSTRRYPVGLEPVGTQATQAASGTSKSAVSRRFVAMTHTALAELLAADLSGLDLVCLLIDGVHFGEHCCVVALGIAIDGTKHPLALVEGSTENATLARGLLVGLRERGLDVTRPILCVIDGAKALRCAARSWTCSTSRDRQMPAAQAQKRPRQAPRAATRPGRAAHARRLPRRLRPGRRSPAHHAGP
jgi:putative transposase